MWPRASVFILQLKYPVISWRLGGATDRFATPGVTMNSQDRMQRNGRPENATAWPKQNVQ
jgi:hypothetical protein